MINCEGCISKQKEIDDLKLEYDKLTDWASEYKAENAKLRECVEWYVSEYHHDLKEPEFGGRARKVLKELEEK